MRCSNIISTFWLFFAFASPATPTASVTNHPTAVKPYRADRILIQPKPGVALTTLGNLHSRSQSRVLRTFANLGNLQIVATPAGETVEHRITQYQQSGLVEFAEPDYLGQVFSTTPNDPAFTNGALWGLYAISAPQAWDVLTAASNIVVAVVDTGVRYTHEDLAANMWVNPNDGGHGWNVIAGNNDPSDDSGHGTGVAGVLGAVGNNGKGVTGVAWEVQIMAVKCFNNLGIGSVSQVIEGLDYAKTNGARIINASWGFPASLALSNEVYSLRDSNIIVVAACGNKGTNIDLNPTYPASYPFDHVVTVAETGTNDTLAASSNYGATSVHLGAPGEQIYSTFAATDSYYLSQSGTSFSAPYVCGACALLMTQYPADSYQQIIRRLLSSTDPLPSLAGKCRTGGRLNLQKALRTILLTTIPPMTSNSFQVRVSGGLNRTCSVEATSDFADWSPVFTNRTSTNGTFDFVDYTATNSAGRFYRATAAP